MKLHFSALPALAMLSSISLSAACAWLHARGMPIPRALFCVLAVGGWLSILWQAGVWVEGAWRRRSWPEVVPVLVALILYCVVSIRLVTTGFSEDDEIYSWNYWAIQHYMGQPASFQFTIAPYPQFFSYWIAGLYHAVGDIKLQSAVRLSLSMPLMLVFSALLLVLRSKTWRDAAISTMLVIGSVAPAFPWYTKGLADPLMAASLAVSAAAMVCYDRERNVLGWALLAGFAAVVAALSKQAGILWACVTFPLAVAVLCRREAWHRSWLAAAGCSLLLGLIWPLFVSPEFTNNQGVINASMAQRALHQQLFFAVREHLLSRPDVLALLGSAVCFGFKGTLPRLQIIFGVLPMTLLWLVLGAYSRRLGAHVFALAAVVVVGVWAGRQTKVETEIAQDGNLGKPLVGALAALTLVACVAAGSALVTRATGVQLADGTLATLQVQYGKSATPVLEDLLAKQSRVWVTGAYAFGPFFGRLPVGLPSHFHAPYTVADAKRDLLAFRADFAVHSGVVGFPEVSDRLLELARQCPSAISPVLQPPNQKSFTLFAVNLRSLESDCP